MEEPHHPGLEADGGAVRGRVSRAKTSAAIAVCVLTGLSLIVLGCGGSSRTNPKSVASAAELRQVHRENQKYEKQQARNDKKERRLRRKQEAKEVAVLEKARRQKTEKREAQKRESAKESSARSQVKAIDTEKGTCSHFPTGPHPFREACEDSYSLCEVEAPRIVERAYHEEGEDSEEWAYKYSRETYSGGTDKFVQGLIEEASFSGCLGAMDAEYDRLYR